jgi:hypothetical protein
LLRPAQIDHGFARQAERKIESSDPETRRRSQDSKSCQAENSSNKARLNTVRARRHWGYGNWFACTWAGGEVDAMDRPGG